MFMVRSGSTYSLAILSLFILSSMSPIIVEGSISGRSQTTWSGTINLNQDYTVAVTDELVISSCTNVTLAFASRIFVEGRLTIEGNQN